jgi:hypothetical protein
MQLALRKFDMARRRAGKSRRWPDRGEDKTAAAWSIAGVAAEAGA